jgi:uridylate kinase
MLNKKTIIIKISGAALKDDNNDSILSTDKLLDLAQQIKELSEFNNVVIINGGGNI